MLTFCKCTVFVFFRGEAAMEWSSGAGTQSYIYLLQQEQEQRLTREAGGGKAEAEEGIKVSAHTGVAPCTGVEESPHWCCTSHNTLLL